MRLLLTSLVVLSFFSSCSTYIIPKQLFIEQFESIDSTQLVDKKVMGPGVLNFKYKANPIQEIKCIDNSGKSSIITNSPSIELRVTENSGRKTVFYFDRILLKNDTLIGVQSRLAPYVDKEIPIKSIERIEIQDGHKNFKYIE